MIHYRYSLYGTAFGVEHRFEEESTALPLHAHEADCGHTTQVLAGRAHLVVRDEPVQTLSPQDGEVTFDFTRLHTLVALKRGTLIFNRLEPRPADWQRRLDAEGDWQCL